MGKVVGYSSLKSAASMNSAYVPFDDEVEKANKPVESGVVINDMFVSVLPLTTPDKRATNSNIPPGSGKSCQPS